MHTPITSEKIKTILANKYAPPVYAFFTEVAKSGVASFNGYIDAVAFSLYPSMNHEIHGFEIKISRSDFLREFEKPTKSEEAMANCHRWWLVAPRGVCDKNELPKSWGFIEVLGERLFKRKQAQLLEPDYNASFIAGLLRRATENVISKSVFWEQVEGEKVEIRKTFEQEIERAESTLEEYRNKVAEFEQASGLEILSEWRGGKELGEATRAILRNEISLDYEIGQLEDELERLRKINRGVKSAMSSKSSPAPSCGG